MPYTGDPANNPSDAVRLEIGDTNPAAPIFSDGEILYFLAQAAQDIIGAAIGAVVTLQARYAGYVNETVGSVSVSGGDRAKGYLELLQQLRRRAATENLGFYAGGISLGDKAAYRSNSDRTPPFFSRNMGNTPGANYLPDESDDVSQTLPGHLIDETSG